VEDLLLILVVDLVEVVKVHLGQMIIEEVLAVDMVIQDGRVVEKVHILDGLVEAAAVVMQVVQLQQDTLVVVMEHHFRGHYPHGELMIWAIRNGLLLVVAVVVLMMRLQVVMEVVDEVRVRH
tara:strand:- start:10 stop:375 length:366 start_codon:yes stop_codon:yes gene_type:complete